MTTYMLRITQQEPNPMFSPNRYEGESNPYREIETLVTIITEQQFDAIRKAVLEYFGKPLA